MNKKITVCFYSFLSFKVPISVDKNVFLLLSTGRAPFIGEIGFLLSGGQRKRGCDVLALAVS